MLGTVVVKVFACVFMYFWLCPLLLVCGRVTHQRSDTMYSRTVFPGVQNSVVRLLLVENVGLLVVSVYTESEELVRLYHWFMLSKRSLSDVT